MSLARTALRLAAVAALEADPVVSALCGPRIFDSLIDELDAKDPVPVIVVYTEDDGGKAFDRQNGGPPFDHACAFTLEISMKLTEVVPDPDDTSASVVQIGAPATDREMEATLDFLEECAVNAVTNADSTQAALIRNAIVRRTTEIRSIRFASAQTGEKIAMRLVTLTSDLLGDDTDPLDPPTGPFAALPDPLRTVALSLDPASSGYATCAALAARLAPPADTPITGVDITYATTSQFDPAHPPSLSDPTASDPLYQSIDLT